MPTENVAPNIGNHLEMFANFFCQFPFLKKQFALLITLVKSLGFAVYTEVNLVEDEARLI